MWDTLLLEGVSLDWTGVGLAGRRRRLGSHRCLQNWLVLLS